MSDSNATQSESLFPVAENTGLEATPDAPVVGGSPLCSICQSIISPEEPATTCPDCSASYHSDCWQEIGGCAIYGCAQVPAPEPRSAAEMPVSYWGRENKPCPVCGHEILAVAIRCRHCGATFASAQPEDAEAFARREALEKRLPKVRQLVVWGFVLSVLPFTAPIGGVWGLLCRLFNDREIKALPPIYSALGKIGIGVGLGQTLLLILMAVLYHAVRT